MKFSDAVVILFHVHSFFFQESAAQFRWKPVLGDVKPGDMPNLESPLGSPFWQPEGCRTKNNLTAFSPAVGPKQKHKQKQKKKKNKITKKRPAGWEPHTLRLASIVLDRWLDLLKDNNTCAFKVRQCCSPGEIKYIRVSRKHQPPVFEPTSDSELVCKSRMSISQGSWGKCAFVAPGAVTLRNPSGQQIDEHDTVDPLEVPDK